MKELVLKNVCKDYKLGNKETFRALSDINVSFNKGELVSIVGESGSGKSTLMNLIGGLDSDFEGEIIVGNTKLNGLKAKELDKYRKNKVGFVFQSFNLIPHLSILDNVTIALTLSGVKESEKVERATQILKKVGLESQLKKKPNQLSGGQKQRVAIARALINNPDIILADEPTGALDSVTTVQILDLLKKIADEGKLVIMVTHSEKVASVSSRVVEISDGKIIRDEKNKKYRRSKPMEKEQATKKEKQNLGFWSAIKLAFHNMWASKTKNFLMAFGVAISISSLILMLSFASGLTGYITNLANEYSSPTIVSISKLSKKKGFDASMFSGIPFEDEDIQELKDELNENALKNRSFKITDDDISYGYMAITGFTQSAKIYYTVDGEEQEENIFTLYTTPPNYSDSNMLEGTLAGEGEAMFSTYLISLFGEDIVGQTIKIKVSLEGVSAPIEAEVKVSGIVDVSAMFSQALVAYIDYDYLKDVVYNQTYDEVTGSAYQLKPSTVYIHTDGQNTTNILNSYIQKSSKYTGSIEQRLASMFSEMMNTFSIALTIIACISLVVATIMILVVLYISVSQRTKEIGVLKSIGARKKDIKLIFTSESFLIGVLSGVAGIILSLIFIGIIKIALTSLIGFAPIALNWYYLIISMGVAIVISMLAGLYPSAKAAKLDPVESLRHD